MYVQDVHMTRIFVDLALAPFDMAAELFISWVPLSLLYSDSLTGSRYSSVVVVTPLVLGPTPLSAFYKGVSANQWMRAREVWKHISSIIINFMLVLNVHKVAFNMNVCRGAAENRGCGLLLYPFKSTWTWSLVSWRQKSLEIRANDVNYHQLSSQLCLW